MQNSDAGNTLSHNVRAGGQRDAVDCDGRHRRQITRPCQNKIDSLDVGGEDGSGLYSSCI